MKILVYSANFAPELTGVGRYSGDMAAWLVEQGHTVRAVAAPPYYPSWKCDPKYAWPPYRREQWRGVDIWRAPLWIPKAPGGVARILHLLSFAITSFPIMVCQIFWRPDLVFTVAPAFLCAPAGWITARLSRGRCWLHLQDFEIDVAFQMGLLTSKLLQRIVLRLEGWFMNRFDCVSSISNRMIERLMKKGVAAQRTRYFPNWVDTAEIEPSVQGEKYRGQLGISPWAVVVLFSGTLGRKQGLMVIPAAARLLEMNKEIVIVVCGDGLMKPELEAAAANLANVRFLPLQPPERLAELLCMADIHLLPQSPRAADLVLPSKLCAMLSSGRPVIATCSAGTEIASIVSNCGKVVPPEDAAALAQSIINLANDRETRLELGRRARACAEAKFARDEILGRAFKDSETFEQVIAKLAAAITMVSAPIPEVGGPIAREGQAYSNDVVSTADDENISEKAAA